MLMRAHGTYLPRVVVKFKHESMDIDVNKAVIEVEHESIGESSFQLASYETGLEGVLNAFADDSEGDGIQNTDLENQIVKLEKSGIGRTELKVVGVVTCKKHHY